jgi:RNA ligase
MNFEFEHADQIADYLDAIAGRDEFIVAEREEGYTVINYLINTPETTFPEPGLATSDDERRKFILRRDCRGIVFDSATGKVIAKRFHKFFNAGEKDETQADKLDLSQPHVILEKLDGSMITPLPIQGKIRWGTKMGLTDVAQPVEEFVKARSYYSEFAQQMISLNLTPIFEWTSRKQRIVIDYPNDNLTLLAIRHNKTGEYVQYDEMKKLARPFNLPVVRTYEGTAENMVELMNTIKGMTGLEGFVLRFDSGHMVKIKGEEYCLLHSTKDMISFEKNVINIVASEKADDIKAFMTADDLARFIDFEGKFWGEVWKTTHELIALREQASLSNYDVDRKTYAVEFVQKQDQKYSRFLYQMFDKIDDYSASVFSLICTTIKNSCSTAAKVDEVRWLFGNIHWNEVADTE